MTERIGFSAENRILSLAHKFKMFPMLLNKKCGPTNQRIFILKSTSSIIFFKGNA